MSPPRGFRPATRRGVSRQHLGGRNRQPHREGYLGASLWDRAGGKADIPVAIAYIDEDIGRGRGDMRTPLNLSALERQGLVVSPDDGAWALTSQGVARIAEHRELSDR